MSDFSELEHLAQELVALPTHVRRQARPVVVEWAGKGAEAMKKRLPDPEPTGEHLRESVTADEKAKTNRDEVSAEFGPEWFVARFREYGTAHEPPRPFAEPTAGDIREQFYDAFDAFDYL